MVITRKNILDIIADNRRYGLTTVSLTFPADTVITRAAMEAARGRIVLNVKKSAVMNKIRSQPGMTVEDFLKARASIAGAAGTGNSKKRGGAQYYSKLAKKRKSFTLIGNERCRAGTH